MRERLSRGNLRKIKDLAELHIVYQITLNYYILCFLSLSRRMEIVGFSVFFQKNYSKERELDIFPSVSRPSLYERIVDHCALFVRGGMRIRIWREGQGFTGTTLGKVGRYTPERLLKIVLELTPEKPGTIHIRYSSEQEWSIKIRGICSDDGFRQRLRNVLVNL